MFVFELGVRDSSFKAPRHLELLTACEHCSMEKWGVLAEADVTPGDPQGENRPWGVSSQIRGWMGFSFTH